MLISSSPWLIAGCRVLHRLLVPRHSPYALFRLNSLSCSILSNLQDRFLLELSQIIVWVVNSKDLSNLHCFFRRCVTTPCSKIVYPLFSGKTLIILNVFLNTTICFVSLFGFQLTFPIVFPLVSTSRYSRILRQLRLPTSFTFA